MQKGGLKISSGSFGEVYTFEPFVKEIIVLVKTLFGQDLNAADLYFRKYFSDGSSGEQTTLNRFDDFNYRRLVYKVIFEPKKRDAELQSLQRVNNAVLNSSLDTQQYVDFVKKYTILALGKLSPPKITIGIVISDSRGDLFSLIPYARCDGDLSNAENITFPEILNIVDSVCRFLYQINTLHHFDIKPANILYTQANNGTRNFILGDYGLVSDTFAWKFTPITSCPWCPSGNVINWDTYQNYTQIFNDINDINDTGFFAYVYNGYKQKYEERSRSDHEFYTKMDIYSLGITLYMLVNENRVVWTDVYNVKQIARAFIDPNTCVSLNDVFAFMSKYNTQYQGGGNKKKKVKLIDGRTRVVCLDNKKHKYIKVDNKECYLKDIRGKYKYV